MTGWRVGCIVGPKHFIAMCDKIQSQKTRVGVPQWVRVMIDIMQFQDCKIHLNTKDHKLDRFCIDCVGSFCSQSCSDHQGHEHVKIRRYLLHEVINRPDFQKYFDCSGIQGYQTNKNKVLFLKSRKDNQQQQNNKDRRCNICNQNLLDASYCSIQCKIFAITTENKEGSAVDDNVLHNASEEPTLTPCRNNRRKGFPYRAPLF
ncbi:putative transaminase transcription repressor PLATZ family [Helianthus annuus]|nr:putative transaminase transcription repressor PLATZ family [Helianthus annuus]